MDNGYEVLAVYTQPDRPVGRGRHIETTPVKKALLSQGIPIEQPETMRTASVVAKLISYHPDIIVVAAYGQILPQAILNIPRLGCINIHPSLLPKHRGASPIPAAIMAGDAFTGVSIMLMDEGLDTGPVLSQVQIPVTATDHTGTLTEKLSLVSAHLVLDVLPRYQRGELLPRAQDHAVATYSTPLNKADGEINWRAAAADNWRQVRAFQPWPGAFTLWRGKRLEIVDSFPLPWVERLEPGTVLDLRQATTAAGFGVATADGVLGVCLVQMAGKKVMPAREFLQGQKDIIGARLPSI